MGSVVLKEWEDDKSLEGLRFPLQVNIRNTILSFFLQLGKELLELSQRLLPSRENAVIWK